MKVNPIFSLVQLLLIGAVILPAVAQPAPQVSSRPLYVPNTTHQNDPLPAGILAWDATSKSVDAPSGQDFARFSFAFTNVAVQMDLAVVTNFSYITNFATVTNKSIWKRLTGRKYSRVATGVVTNTRVATVTNSITPIPVTVLNVHPSCGCTTAEVPPMPWILPPGTNSIINVKVNLAGKSGTFFKSVNIATDKGKMDLMLRITILPAPPAAPLSPAERARQMAVAKADRQAVFKGDCASCHVKDVASQYNGPQIFATVCAVCHEANPRATMVPDLRHLKEPTSTAFWQTWITAGKPGTLMPAFARSLGGPLNDAQILLLATYLNQSIPPHPATLPR